MNKFKTILKIFSSRLFYLVIGIFLAVGATYVYATWDQAKTASSGQLTEGNWNELISMLQSSLDSTYTASFTIFPYDTNPNCGAYGYFTCSSTTCPAGWTTITTFSYDIEDYYDPGQYSCSDLGYKKRCTATVCGLPR